MDWIEREPLPAVCQNCADRLTCLTRGEGEWCCEECENLLERFALAECPQEAEKHMGGI